MNLLYVVLLGFALFFAMLLINRMANLIPGQNQWVKLLRRSLPLFELIAWLGYVFWAANIVFTDFATRRLVTGVMAVVIIIALGWYVLRDFLYGILLKTENTLSKGQIIKAGFATGKITGIGYRTLQLETDRGDKLRVPYSRLSDAIITQPPPKGQSHTHTLSFNLKGDQPLQLITNKVYRELVNMPWVISESEPGVTLVHADTGQVSLEVKFTVMNEEHAVLVSQKLEALLS